MWLRYIKLVMEENGVPYCSFRIGRYRAKMGLLMRSLN